MKIMFKTLSAALLASACIGALAKLPPLSDEAKAKAAEAAARAAWTGKQEVFLLCKTQDKVAASYFKTAKAAGKDVKPPAEGPQCADTGPFAYTPPEAKPLESSGAHSPAGNATSPPSTTQPDAIGNPAKK